MARAKKTVLKEDEDEETLTNWDEEEEAFSIFDGEPEVCNPAKREKYTVLVRFTVKTSDPDTAEDVISDLVSSGVAEFGDNYEPEAELLDYSLEEVEPGEL